MGDQTTDGGGSHVAAPPDAPTAVWVRIGGLRPIAGRAGPLSLCCFARCRLLQNPQTPPVFARNWPCGHQQTALTVGVRFELPVSRWAAGAGCAGQGSRSSCFPLLLSLARRCFASRRSID